MTGNQLAHEIVKALAAHWTDGDYPLSPSALIMDDDRTIFQHVAEYMQRTKERES